MTRRPGVSASACTPGRARTRPRISRKTAVAAPLASLSSNPAIAARRCALAGVPIVISSCHSRTSHSGAITSGKTSLSDEEYDTLLKPMGKELSAMARWVSETRQRMIILFEGRDTAGKGGSIDMFARVLNPRQCRVVALPSPNERERTEWYFQRYVEHFPAEGEIVLYDRSWYNRAGVEKVMGYCTPQQTEAFPRTVPEFERQITDDGILFFK